MVVLVHGITVVSILIFVEVKISRAIVVIYISSVVVLSEIWMLVSVLTLTIVKVETSSLNIVVDAVIVIW